jgi:antitoxin component HigA of HigAB toxin-antitoxin module
VAKIVRNKNYRYVVEAHRQSGLNPDVVAVVKRFVDRLNAGAIDLHSVIGSLTADEMAQHARVAKRLALEGKAA